MSMYKLFLILFDKFKRVVLSYLLQSITFSITSVNCLRVIILLKSMANKCLNGITVILNINSQVFLDLRIIKTPADQSLGGIQCVLRVGDSLTFSRHAC